MSNARAYENARKGRLNKKDCVQVILAPKLRSDKLLADLRLRAACEK